MHLGGAAFRHLRTLEGIMDRKIPNLPPAARLDEAIASMLEHAADYLIVSQDERPVGILTGRDSPACSTASPTPARFRSAAAMTLAAAQRHIGHRSPGHWGHKTASASAIQSVLDDEGMS